MAIRARDDDERLPARYSVFAPGRHRPATATADWPDVPSGGVAKLRWAAGLVRAFYRHPIGWLALLTTAVVFSYGGGLAMFWYHAVQLGEGGPAISWYAHWLLDSTFAFVGLMPVYVLMVPLAALVCCRYAAQLGERLPLLYVGLTGFAFAVVTVPGPLGHDLIVGRGTWIAARTTELIGDPSAPLATRHDYPLVVTLAQQFGAGVPIYLTSAAVSVLLVRAVLAASGRAVTARAAAR